MDVMDSDEEEDQLSSEVESVKPHRPSAVSVWSASGAAILVAISVALLPFLVPMPGEAWELSKWETFAGNMHFLVLHLPIGLFVWVFILEVLGLLSFGKYKPPTALPLFFGVIFGVIAVILGYYLYLQESSQSDLITKHMWGSIVFVVLGALTYMTKISALRTGSRSPIYGVLLCCTVAAMGLSTHWGGESVHNNPFAVLRAADEEEEEQPELEPVEVSVEELLAYEQVVVPILETKCYECHSVDKKKKGKLLMDSYAALLEGGAEAPALVPGDLEESLMITRIHLPLDDEDEEHMPPADEEQLTEEEIEILEWWVATGAPQNTTLQAAGAPPEILSAAGEVLSLARRNGAGEEPPQKEQSEGDKATALR